MDGFIYSFIKIIPDWIRPNHLSFFRIVLVGPIVFLLLNGKNIAAIVIFLFAILLDVFDGVLARTRGQRTARGEWLDPLADKFLVLGVLWLYGLSFIPLWMVIVITSLEFLIVVSRPFKMKLGKSTGANQWGKIKMTLQSFAVLGLMTGIETIRPVFVFLLLPAIVFAGLSFFFQFRGVFGLIFSKKN